MQKKIWIIIDTVIIGICVLLSIGKIVQSFWGQNMLNDGIQQLENQIIAKTQDESVISDTTSDETKKNQEDKGKTEDSMNDTDLDNSIFMSSSYEEEIQEVNEIHSYEIYVTDVTWEEACQRCIELGGHLVTFDSEEELLEVLNKIAEEGYDNIKFYIGAKRESGIAEYRWFNSDGEYYGKSINDSSHWLSGEPSFYDAELEANKGIRVEECCVNMFYYQDEARWVWNDIPNDLLGAASYYSGKIGFICEYDD